jgi:hypothetical protein
VISSDSIRFFDTFAFGLNSGISVLLEMRKFCVFYAVGSIGDLDILVVIQYRSSTRYSTANHFHVLASTNRHRVLPRGTVAARRAL